MQQTIFKSDGSNSSAPILMPMKRQGRPTNATKAQASEDDYRTALSLLPGKLIARRHLEQELTVLRAGVQSGEHREWLGLMPGLEMALEGLSEGLEVLGDIIRSGYGTNGHQQAVVGPPQPPQDRPAVRAGSLDVESVLANCRDLIRKERPVLSIVLLAELITRGRINRKEFVERWRDHYSFKSGSVISISLARLKTLDIHTRKCGMGWLELVTRVSGKFPPPLADNPLILRALATNNDGDKKPLALPESQPATETADSTAQPEANLRPKKFSGFWKDILLQEFHASPDKAVDLNVLAKKYSTKISTFNFVMAPSKILYKRGYRFKRISSAVHRLIKEGKQDRQHK